MKHILHLFVFLATPLLSLGQNSLINSSISSGIGNCYTTQEGVWSLSTNPAGVANHNQYSETIYYNRDVIRSGWDGMKLKEID